MTGLNEQWEVVSFDYNKAYVETGYTVYFKGSYKACVDFVATVKSGRIQKRSRAVTRPHETNKETIARLLHLAPKTNYAKGINYDV
jgi:hypothetical protein